MDSIELIPWANGFGYTLRLDKETAKALRKALQEASPVGESEFTIGGAIRIEVEVTP